MYYIPTSCLVLFSLFSLFHHLSSASSETELGWCKALFQCGNITAGFPFSGLNRPEVCGHPSLELHCFNNITSIIISDHFYNVLHIDQTYNTLKLSRAELEGSFCNATFTATDLPSEIFELLPAYKSLTVFYLCDPKIPYGSSYTCPNRGPVSVSQNPDYHRSCQDSFKINVPKSFVPEEKELNVTHLEIALREGFEVKLKINEKACKKCLSLNGTCGLDNSKQICCKEASSSECKTFLHIQTADDLFTRCNGTFSCGDQSGLFYPFSNKDREGCGHPDFQLECNTNSAEISISSVKFRILEANSSFIRLARSDFINNTCPSYPSDAPFNENVLQFAPGTEMLTIYYDCNQDFSSFDSTFTGKLDCEDDASDSKTNYYVTRNLSSPLLRSFGSILNDFSRFCDRKVSIPASRTVLDLLESNENMDDLKKALDQGFVLALYPDCSRCIHSGGACGYSKDTNRFICYSKHKDEGLSTGVKAGIAVGGVGAFTYIAAALLLCMARRRKKTQEAQYTSKDLPITSYSRMVEKSQSKTSNELEQKYLKALIPLKHYSYAQVKRISKSFTEVVGKGGFGTVYKGTLCDGRIVAVKILKDSKGNGEDFINEVASISKTSHVNIVSLLGFCSEGSKRAIIYEYLENGSLDQYISSSTSMNMDWMELYGIALGVARGLEYLHHGCKTRIVHFDIKPQNVLLDDKLCPKVSDFGLAKLCEKKESILSLLDTRGTIGYIAPEVFSRMYGRVSYKSDVYSYGMLVLEIIGARKKRSTENSASNPSSMYFPEWIYKEIEKGDDGRPNVNGITSEEEEIAKKMTLVGLWCIQPSPSDRPPMNRVVEMMEGNLNALEVPPRPVLQIPAASRIESSMLAEDISVYTDV